MTPSTLQGVLYGHGHMGRLHASKLSSRPDVALHVVDPGLGLASPLEHDPDFAIIATPTVVHADVATPLLKQGVPCLIEKPLANSISDAIELADHTHLSVGHIERYNPVFVPVTRCAPEFVEVERLAPFSSRSTDVDVIADLMIHDLDLLLQFMPGEILDVRAKGVGVVSDSPDIVHARIEVALHTGKVGVATISASRVSTVAVRRWRLVEPGQYWSLDLLSRTAKKICWSDGSLSPEPVEVPAEDPLTLQHNAFLAAVRGKGPFPCSGTEALAAMKLAERVRSCLR